MALWQRVTKQLQPIIFESPVRIQAANKLERSVKLPLLDSVSCEISRPVPQMWHHVGRRRVAAYHSRYPIQNREVCLA
jgi:hypothetical protein